MDYPDRLSEGWERALIFSAKHNVWMTARVYRKGYGNDTVIINHPLGATEAGEGSFYYERDFVDFKERYCRAYIAK